MDAAALKKAYLKWLTDNETYVDLSPQIVRINTPFLDNSFDEIVLYAITYPDKTIKLTDDGWTMDYLESHGFTFRKGSHRYNLLYNTIKTYGLSIDSEEIFVKCDSSKFPIAKQRMVQGLLKIYDLILLNDTNVVNTFKEDLFNALIKNEVAYDAPYVVTGENGYSYTFDFSIPVIGGTKKLVNAITQPNKISNAKLYMVDAQLSHAIDSTATFYAILNDKEKINNLDEINDLFLNQSSVPITPILGSDSKTISKVLTNKVA